MSDFEPIQLVRVDLSQPLPTIQSEIDNTPYQKVRLVVTHVNQPLGSVDIDIKNAQLQPEEYLTEIWQVVHETLNAHLEDLQLPQVTELSTTGLPLAAEHAYHHVRAQIKTSGPLVSIVICTRERTADLQKCLPSILALDYPNFEVILIDNAPETNATRDFVATTYRQDARVRYILEEKPGLSIARNTGLFAAQGEFVAFTDDDAVADPNWLVELVRVFTEDDQVACVTGLTLPAELETEPQLLFEQFGGFNKGRGFTQMRFNFANNGQEPLFPYLAAQFGSGVNMAYRTKILRELGGFDEALGAGTVTGGAEDIDAYFRVIMAGYTLVYEPSALLSHYHRRDYAGLKKQLGNNGTAFGAFVMKTLMVKPWRLIHLLLQVPYAVYYLFSPKSKRNTHKEEAYPSELTQGELGGMLRGPWLYLKSRRQLKQLKSS